jgi:tetratricopeptide (TPR) repeat protein
VNIKEMPQIGLSWFLEDYRELKIVYHGGGDTGFRSFLLLVPGKNISVEVVSNYELCPVRDLAFGILDMLLDYKPEIIRRQIGFAFAEILEEEGLENAKDFYKNTEKDSIQYKYYIWQEAEGAMAYAGWSLLRQSMFNEALEIFKFDLELNPGSGHAYGNLGIAYARSGNKKLAKLNLEKCIKLFPDEGFYKEELKKLSKQ